MGQEKSNIDTSLSNLPDGWIYLNKKFVEENFAEKLGKDLSKNKVVENFFNGRMQTSFDVALTSNVPRRFYVEDLQEKINSAARNDELRVTLLTGPGGEGKSTILQQLSIDLASQNEPKFHIFFRDFGSQSNLPIKYLEKLLDSNDESNTTHNFLIVSDNAHEIAKDVFSCIESGIEYKKHNIQFLLASRGTHWRWQEAHRSNWKRLVNDDYEIKIAKLTEEDAEKIVIAWDKANGQNNNIKELAAKLFNATKDEKISGKSSNSFYRAIFQLRKNKTLESYISDILDEFEKIQILDGRLTLKDFYAYIVILHADGFPLLNMPVLCQALGCEENKLREAIELLADEKYEFFAESNKYLLTRHDVFAEEAKKVLQEQNYPTYFDKILSELVIAAYQYYKDYETNSKDIQKWHRLPGVYFYDLAKDDEENKLTRRREAIAMAGALGKRFYSEPVLISQWANFLRQDGKLENAAEVIKSYYSNLTPDKGYFVEWAVILGLLEKNFLSAWLSGVVLHNEIKEVERGREPPIHYLCSLGTALGKSFEKVSDTNNEAFYNPRHANIFKSATEGVLRLISDERAKVNAKLDFDFVESEREKAEIHKRIGNGVIPEISLEKSFESIEAGIELAYQLRNLDNEELPASLPRPPLNLNNIKSIFGVGVNVTDQKIAHTFITKVLVKKEPTQIISQAYTESTETTENLNYVFRKLTNEWEFVFEDKNAKISDKYELEGFKYIKLALASPNLEIDVSSNYPSQAIHHSIYNNIKSRVFDAINNFEFSIPNLFIYLNKTIQVSGAKGKVTILYRTTESVVKEVDDDSSGKTKKIKIEHPKNWLT